MPKPRKSETRRRGVHPSQRKKAPEGTSEEDDPDEDFPRSARRRRRQNLDEDGVLLPSSRHRGRRRTTPEEIDDPEDEDEPRERDPLELVTKRTYNLSKDLIVTIAEFIRDGHRPLIVAQLLAIPVQTLAQWLDWGQSYLDYEEVDPDQMNPDHELHAALVLTCERAMAEYRMDIHKKVHKPGGDWVQFLKVAERRDPMGWGENATDDAAVSYDGGESYL